MPDESAKLLEWNGIDCHIIVNGYRFETNDKPLLSFDFAGLFYDTESGSRMYVTEDGEQHTLSDIQVAEINDLLDYFMEETDFKVQAYSEPSMFFEGEMQRSTAEAYGFKYRVNEIPDYAAMKWMGDHWERLYMVVMDNGNVIFNPESVCSHCVYGFAESEKDQVPDRPSVFHTWDVVNGGWIDSRTLEDAKKEAAVEIRVAFEFLRNASAADGYYIPAYESETWTCQVMEAKAWLADHDAETPYIDAFLDARTDEEKPTKQALCEDIVANNAAFLRTMARINGAQWGFLVRAKHATTNDECIAIQNEAHVYCDEQQALLGE